MPLVENERMPEFDRPGIVSVVVEQLEERGGARAIAPILAYECVAVLAPALATRPDRALTCLHRGLPGSASHAPRPAAGRQFTYFHGARRRFPTTAHQLGPIARLNGMSRQSWNNCWKSSLTPGT